MSSLHLRPCFPSHLFLSYFRLKCSMPFSSFPFVVHVPPIPISSMFFAPIFGVGHGLCLVQFLERSEVLTTVTMKIPVFCATLPTLRSNLLPPIPWQKFYYKGETFVMFYHITWRHIPENSIYKYERILLSFQSLQYSIYAMSAGTIYRLR
jgi:hypothetical protein